MSSDYPNGWGVYTLHDHAGRPIYTGMTGNLRKRLAAHRSIKHGMWTTWEWTPCPDKATAEAEERKQIREKNPLLNVDHRTAMTDDNIIAATEAWNEWQRKTEAHSRVFDLLAATIDALTDDDEPTALTLIREAKECLT